eukprot:8771351-Pyramimonas_sp.AAC.1
MPSVLTLALSVLKCQSRGALACLASVGGSSNLGARTAAIFATSTSRGLLARFLRRAIAPCYGPVGGEKQSQIRGS